MNPVFPFKSVMLAADLAKAKNDLSTIPTPVLGSPKLDGIRSVIWEGVAWSRNGKVLPNKFIQDWAKQHHNLDGEFIVGSPIGDNVFGTTQSGVKSVEGEPDFNFHLFDCIEGIAPDFQTRLGHVQDEHQGAPRIVCVPHEYLSTTDDLERYEANCVEMGYEGMMLRDPEAPYKFGRSTLPEGWLIKVKRFIDGTAVVIGVEEAEQNNNVAFKDELGRTKRSSHKANMSGKGMIGVIIVKDPKWGVLRLQPGKMTHPERIALWEKGKGKPLIGQKVEWRAFGYGLKDLPRFARYYGVRFDA